MADALWKLLRGVLFGTSQLVLHLVALAIFPFHLGAQEEGKLKISERRLCARDQLSNFTLLTVLRCHAKGEKRLMHSLGAEKMVKLGIRAAASAFSRHSDLFFLQGHFCCASHSYPKAKIPPFEQDKHSHGKGTLCSPEEMQSRCSCRGHASL